MFQVLFVYLSVCYLSVRNYIIFKMKSSKYCLFVRSFIRLSTFVSCRLERVRNYVMHKFNCSKHGLFVCLFVCPFVC
jgi:hypothetical protein